MNRQEQTKQLAIGGITAALYVVLTFVSAAMGLASGDIQVRLSEALCILPVFSFAAVPGLTLGCFLANLLTGCAPLDVVFGTIATLIGAVGTYLMRKKNRAIAWLPPVISNTLIVPFILAWVYNVEQAIPIMMLTVGAGELISCGILGTVLRKVMEKNNFKL